MRDQERRTMRELTAVGRFRKLRLIPRDTEVERESGAWEVPA